MKHFSKLFTLVLCLIFVAKISAMDITALPDSIQCGTTSITGRTGCSFAGVIAITIVGNPAGVTVSNITPVVSGVFTFDITVTSQAPLDIELQYILLASDDPTGCAVVGEEDFSDLNIDCGCSLDVNTTSTNETCFNCENGTASVDVSGGMEPITYQWSNGAVTSSVDNLAPGDYILVITDANGCNMTVIVTINPYICTPFNVFDQVTDVQCFGECNGSVIISGLSNGSTAFTTLWNNGSTTPTQTNLCPGVYIVTVTDTDQCATVITYLIDQPIPLTLDPVEINDATVSQLGSIYTNPGGGTGPYILTLSLNGALIQTSPTGQFDGLVPGCYVIQLTDATGCVLSMDSLCVEDGLLAGKKLNISGLNVYPNPASEIINISMDKNEQVDEIVIYNSTGILLGKYKNVRKIDVSNFTNGVYFISFKNQNKIQTIPLNILH